MEVRIKNLGNKVFLMCGQWLEKGAEATVMNYEFKLLQMMYPKTIVVITETKKKRK